ncbi:hypothetical protein Kpol_1063p3 [Vanderwaltozyma polyspora DSM 70294]|uniref:BZIP domain-containing protein n=1 Tax=Vanderwaltozyma polyspora (strain ATCC 22028 / DSM 70294 / BCRC 21397 / CBS 2163 / NBRC 10782 / NRRL Y-8283 / UCD 57-17) TaxID=436907 RepID=A7TQP8_VANPO|nr:uncharacterized protein Kpol_1063p3 [Vanderwaltozyma polyspora DSM 70294]EDO15393.1 hypothetical protein Kpol_1063p3 [Vanderwaltozyma polyspora DSM 70294]
MNNSYIQDNCLLRQTTAPIPSEYLKLMAEQYSELAQIREYNQQPFYYESNEIDRISGNIYDNGRVVETPSDTEYKLNDTPNMMDFYPSNNTFDSDNSTICSENEEVPKSQLEVNLFAKAFNQSYLSLVDREAMNYEVPYAKIKNEESSPKISKLEIIPSKLSNFEVKRKSPSSKKPVLKTLIFKNNNEQIARSCRNKYLKSDTNSLNKIKKRKLVLDEERRAYLLEKNRAAASKCRRKKKIEELQLKTDVARMSKENIFLKNRIQYYEKWMVEFQIFLREHLKSCMFDDNTNSMVNEFLQNYNPDIYNFSNDTTGYC